MNINRSVNVNREDLLLKLKEGRDQHLKDFQQADRDYHEAAVKFLQQALRRARKGDLSDITFRMMKPESHVGEYDQIIAMMEASVDEVISLDSASFRAYWMGEWEWKRSFESATAMIGGYLKSAGKLR